MLRFSQELPEELLRFNAVGLIFPAMDTGTLIDNIAISNDIQAANAFAGETFWVGKLETLFCDMHVKWIE